MGSSFVRKVAAPELLNVVIEELETADTEDQAEPVVVLPENIIPSIN